MGRRRFVAYFGVALIIVWTVGTYYLAVHSSRMPPRSVLTGSLSPSVEERAEQLKQKLLEVEAAIMEQNKENSKLLNYFKEAERKRREDAAKKLEVGGGQPPSERPAEPAGAGAGAPPGSVEAFVDSPIAVLVFACNRPAAIRAHLDKLLKLRPSKSLFPVIVSQDCNHEETTKAILSYGEEVMLIQQPDQSEITLPPKEKKFLGYYKIARHYRWALNQTFFKFKYRAAIVTEDDLDLAVDFFEYFVATYPILRKDKSLMCVSAWNDNGKKELIELKAERLYRTDFFPGLGWMMGSEVWEELSPKWPPAFWDDWLRKPEQRLDRACLRPEVSRTAMSHHGKVGVSKGLFFEKHLKHIVLNQQFVAFRKGDLSYLLKEKYDQEFVKTVYESPSITQPELRGGKLSNGQPLPPSIRLTYDNKNTYKVTAKAFGLMDDFRAGVPRTAYRGVVTFVYEKTRVFLAPPADWNGYDPNWS